MDRTIKPWDQTARVSSRSISSNDQLVGMFYGEIAADGDVKTVSLMSARSDSVCEQYEAFQGQRFYSQRTSEEIDPFQSRIDDGRCDELIEAVGLIGRVGRWWRFLVRETKPKANDCVSQPFLLPFADGIICKGLKSSNDLKLDRIASNDFSEMGLFRNLTIRQKNNILLMSNRFLISGNPKLKERGMVHELTNADLGLLRATREANVVGMIQAIADGAYINAADPETGSTALHIAAEKSELVCLFVLIYDEQFHSDLLELVEEETDLDRVLVDTQLRSAQRELDPTILDNDNRLAINCAPVPPEDTELSQDPVAALQLESAFHMFLPTSDALEAIGVTPDIIHDDLYTPEQRAALINAAKASGKGSTMPPPEPNGLG